MTALGTAEEVGAALLKPATIAAASLGATVVVLVNELAVPVFVSVLGLDVVELEDDEELPLLSSLPPFLRTRTEISSFSESMKVNNGPATIALLCRSMTPPFKG